MKKLIIITGASSGIGREFAKQLYFKLPADEMWLLARRKEKLDALAKELHSQTKNTSGEKKGMSVRSVEIDIGGKKGAAHFKELLAQEASKNDISIAMLVNNAGFGTYGPFENTDTEREMDMIDLNCTALTGICGYALPFMAKGSQIINVSSLAAFMPLGNFAVYAATKSYVLSFTQALAAEVSDKGIKVCALCPGSVSTEFANVASNGARKEVLHGLSAPKVVSHCLKKSTKGKHSAIMSAKWAVTAFLSRFFGRYFIARLTYKFAKRPANPMKNR
ncbi:SDR family NAD(P)-dependent oxidoreductase [Treponema parvum]|uniref:SDR family NAD(P)-dependent oxidoreductase n=1 Tax=Treponema parvum TaxID=138851 RepID=A0A975IET9_9SPIR|nr:SDR family NAD(P)-dependent oxidoreductase [Treponema parvum]QTQ14400.1 SDR family NAD(P)-dependent oxidoreductase [Treponema parvum]